MDWLTDLMITFAAVAANHLGLVSAIERTTKHRLPILNCPKCLTFWAVTVYGTLSGPEHPRDIIGVCAVALLLAWAAIWLELAMGFIDQLYLKAYDTVYPAENPTDADA